MINFIMDKERNFNNEEDLLNFDIYVDNLEKIIINSPNTSFTIGLFGDWGSGKSSIIKTVIDNFERNNSSNIKFIEYDVWKYSKFSFMRTFLLSINEKLNLKKDLNQIFYVNSTEEVSIRYTINKKITIVYLLASFLPPLIFNHGGKEIINNFFNLNIYTFFHSDVVLGFLFLIGPIIIAIIDQLRPFKTVISKPYFFASEQFENLFNELVDDYFKQENIDKLVFVIDNIDRCNPNEAYEILSFVKTFLKKDDTIFIIPLDDNALKSANILDRGFSDEFFRKLFNVTLRIKKIENMDIRNFSYYMSIMNDINLSHETIDLLSDVFIKNPRRIIQFLNNLQVELCYFDDEFIKKNESNICKALIMKEEYPNVYEYYFNNFSDLSNLQLDNEELLINYFGEEGKKFQQFKEKWDFHWNIDDFNAFNRIFHNFEGFKGIDEEFGNFVIGCDKNTEKYLNDKKYRDMFKFYINSLIREYYDKHNITTLTKYFDFSIKYYDYFDENLFTELTWNYLFRSMSTIINKTSNISNLLNYSKHIYKNNSKLINSILNIFDLELGKGRKSENINIKYVKVIINLFNEEKSVLNYVSGFLHYLYIGDVDEKNLYSFWENLTDFQKENLYTYDLIDSFCEYMEHNFSFALHNLTYFINIIPDRKKSEVLGEIHKFLFNEFKTLDEDEVISSLVIFLDKGDFKNVNGFRFDNSLTCIYYALKVNNCSSFNLNIIKKLMEQYIETSDNPQVFN